MDYEDLKLIGGALKGLSLPTSETPVRTGSLAVFDGGIQVRSGGEWHEVANILEEVALFEFTSFQFDTAGLTGRSGPTLAQCLARSSYKAAAWASNTSFFNVVGGIQRFTVPSSGKYRLLLKGASSSTKAYPLDTQVELTLVKGDVLSILVGQYGPELSGSGGTFVVSRGQGLIAVAGGAGGASSSNTTTYSPSLENGTSTSGGLNLGSATARGNGGAGYSGNGRILSGSPDVAALSYTNGGTGGLPSNSPTSLGVPGGFGGGGGYFLQGQNYGAGGGGGYTGGNGGQSSLTTVRGVTGRSYYSPVCLNPSITAGPNAPRSGSCLLTKL